MFYYSAYGVEIHSNVKIPGLLEPERESSLAPALKIWLDLRPDWFQQYSTSGLPASSIWYVSNNRDDRGIPNLTIWLIDDRYFCFQYADSTEFIIDRLGTEIWAKWPDDLTLEDTATYLLGPILGFVLRLRNTVCLHASAIAINDRVLVLVGAAGAGKSTTAAAFAQQGYSILSDDVVALADLGDRYLVQPAYPRIRLWNSSVQALYGTTDALPRIVPTHPTWDKRYLDLTQSDYKFQSEPLPLAAIYYLNPRSDAPACPQIEPISKRERLMLLVANTYGNNLLDKDIRAKEFELLSRLIQCVPICKITPHTDVTRLSQLLETIIQDFHASVAK